MRGPPGKSEWNQDSEAGKISRFAGDANQGGSKSSGPRGLGV